MKKKWMKKMGKGKIKSRIDAINLANNLSCKSQPFYSGNYGD